VLDLFTSEASFSLLVPSQSGMVDEKTMSTFEALSTLDSEGISQLVLAKETLNIDFDPQAGLSLFYATYDGKRDLFYSIIICVLCAGVCQHGFLSKAFRVSFMLGNGREAENQTNFRVLATKMQFT